MKRSFLALVALLALTALFVIGGCSSDQSTSPNATDIASQKMTGVNQFLIGYTGERPDAALQAAPNKAQPLKR